MRYAKEHRTKTRQKIVENAYRLFVAKGYAATSIDEIMRQCGLTHGGFYAHFQSKSALYCEAIEYAAARGELLAVRPDGDRDGWVDAVFEEQVQADSACTSSTARLGLFAADAASRDTLVRAAYTDAFKFVTAGMRSRTLARRPGEDAVLGLAAMIVGAAAIARSTDDAALKRKLLKSCRESARMLLDRSQEQVLPVYFWMAAAN